MTRTKRILGGFGAILILAAIGAVTVAFWRAGSADRALTAAVSAENPTGFRDTLLALSPEDFSGDHNRDRRAGVIDTARGMSPDLLMALFGTAELTDEQREKLWKNGEAILRGYMKDVVDGYFALVNASASQEEQLAYLDTQIDTWVPFMEKMREYREAHKDDPQIKAMEERERERWRKVASRDDRKQQIESSDPDQQARMFFYVRKAMERARERGIQMGPGRGPRQEPPASAPKEVDQKPRDDSGGT
jgi:hypothetical protein